MTGKDSLSYSHLSQIYSFIGSQIVSCSRSTDPDSQPDGQQRLELRSATSWSKSVQVMAAALSALKAAAEPFIAEGSFPAALPTFPSFPGLPIDFIQETMKTANIEMLGDQRVAPVGAAAAANGLGLCQNFTDIYACENEETSMPTNRLLAVEYTKSALSITLSPFQASRTGYDWINSRAWDLGSNARPSATETSKEIEKYWQRVREEIQKIPARVPADRSINRVLVMGESVLREEFLRVMQDALHDVLPDGVLAETQEHRVVDPTFAAARGAAEFGKRMMESPDGCAEPAICRYWRRWIG